MTYRIRMDKIVSAIGYNIVAAEGKIIGKVVVGKSPTNRKQGTRVTFVGDSRMMLPAIADLEAGKLPVCLVEEWQIRC